MSAERVGGPFNDTLKTLDASEAVQVDLRKVVVDPLTSGSQPRIIAWLKAVIGYDEARLFKRLKRLRKPQRRARRARPQRAAAVGRGPLGGPPARPARSGSRPARRGRPRAGARPARASRSRRWISKPGRLSAFASARAAVALAPGEDLDRDARRRRARRAPLATGPGLLDRAPQQQRAGEVGRRASARRGASRSARAPSSRPRASSSPAS